MGVLGFLVFIICAPQVYLKDHKEETCCEKCKLSVATEGQTGKPVKESLHTSGSTKDKQSEANELISQESVINEAKEIRGRKKSKGLRNLVCKTLSLSHIFEGPQDKMKTKLSPNDRDKACADTNSCSIRQPSRSHVDMYDSQGNGFGDKDESSTTKDGKLSVSTVSFPTPLQDKEESLNEHGESKYKKRTQTVDTTNHNKVVREENFSEELSDAKKPVHSPQTGIENDTNNASRTPYEEFLHQSAYLVDKLRRAEEFLHRFIESASELSVFCINWVTDKAKRSVIFCVDYLFLFLEKIFVYITYVVEYISKFLLLIFTNIFWVLIWISAFLIMTVITYPVTLLSWLLDLLVNFVINPSSFILVPVLAVFVFVVVCLVIYTLIVGCIEKRKNKLRYRRYNELTLLQNVPTQEIECCICFGNTLAVRLDPCGHSELCQNCALKILEMGNRLCPLCRSNISSWNLCSQ